MKPTTTHTTNTIQAEFIREPKPHAIKLNYLGHVIVNKEYDTDSLSSYYIVLNLERTQPIGLVSYFNGFPCFFTVKPLSEPINLIYKVVDIKTNWHSILIIYLNRMFSLGFDIIDSDRCFLTVNLSKGFFKLIYKCGNETNYYYKIEEDVMHE